jgi:ubiquinone/menaquinone biosynthesis C-methylase UbiE
MHVAPAPEGQTCMIIGARLDLGQNEGMSTPSDRSRMITDTFDRAAPTYESVGVPWFTPIGAGLARELAPAAGQRGLDIGSGRGAVLLPLASAVGPDGHVTGIDLSSGMVESLRADVRDRGLTNVDVLVQDAEDPDFDPATFDLLAASLVLFFLPDPAAALRRWHELLVPGGRIGITTFGPRDANFVAVDDVFVPFLPPQMLDARTSGVVGPFSSDQGMEDLLTATGFAKPWTAGFEMPAVFRDAAHWEAWSRSHGQRRMWDAVPEDRHREVRAEVARILEGARDDTGRITLRQQIRYTLAHRG